MDAFGTAECESLFGSHGDEVALDLRYQAECKAKYLAVNTVVECITVFRTVNRDFTFETFSDDRHDFSQCTTQSRQFGNNKDVSLFEAA